MTQPDDAVSRTVPAIVLVAISSSAEDMISNVCPLEPPVTSLKKRKKIIFNFDAGIIVIFNFTISVTANRPRDHL